MKYTCLGNTGLNVSRLGLGGTSYGMRHDVVGWRPDTPDGRAEAINTIRYALDQGINYVDTAPAYGDGLSEQIVGAALRGRREQVVLASKVSPDLDAAGIRSSVQDSLRRLQTTWLDVIQFHGGTYSPEQTRRLLNDGPLETLEALRDEGKVRFLGFTSTEDQWPSAGMMRSERFDMCQLQYNLIQQAAAQHALPTAAAMGLGVAVMRPLASGAWGELTRALAFPWDNDEQACRVALRFLLSDSRVHVINAGMRFVHEVQANVRWINNDEPTFDVAQLPRSVGQRYRRDTKTTL